MKNSTNQKVRGKLVRKGLFTQLPLNETKAEAEVLLFRTVLDRALFDMTGKDYEERLVLYDWLNINNNDFNEVCNLADLIPTKVLHLFEIFIEKFFPEIKQEMSCHNH